MDAEQMDFAVGSVIFEVEILLASDSGRPKHTDLTEQGAWLLPAVVRGLQSLTPGGGVEFGDVRYVGEGPSEQSVISRLAVGEPIGPFPEDQVALSYVTLVSIIRELALMIGRATQHLDDPDILLEAADPNTVNDVVELVRAVVEMSDLARPAFEAWGDGFEIIRRHL